MIHLHCNTDFSSVLILLSSSFGEWFCCWWCCWCFCWRWLPGYSRASCPKRNNLTPHPETLASFDRYKARQRWSLMEDRGQTSNQMVGKRHVQWLTPMDYGWDRDYCMGSFLYRYSTDLLNLVFCLKVWVGDTVKGATSTSSKKGLLFYLSTYGRLSSKDFILGSTLEAIGPEGDH